MQLDAGVLGEMRRAQQLALQVVGPAVQRADDVLRVAAALQHDRLAVAADVGEQFDAADVRVAHQHLGVVHPVERAVVADVRAPSARGRRSPAPASNSSFFSRAKISGSKYQDTGSWQLAAAAAQRGEVGHVRAACRKCLKARHFT